MEEYGVADSRNQDVKSSSSSSCLRGHWRPAEDEKLRKLVEQFGPQNWNSIAEKLQGRSGKSCRLRWFNQLDPRINRKPFSEEEEEILIAAHRIHGNKWAFISRLFPGRTDNAVKNHWHVLKARRQRQHSKKPSSSAVAAGHGVVPAAAATQLIRSSNNNISSSKRVVINNRATSTLLFDFGQSSSSSSSAHDHHHTPTTTISNSALNNIPPVASTNWNISCSTPPPSSSSSQLMRLNRSYLPKKKKNSPASSMNNSNFVNLSRRSAAAGVIGHGTRDSITSNIPTNDFLDGSCSTHRQYNYTSYMNTTNLPTSAAGNIYHPSRFGIGSSVSSLSNYKNTPSPLSPQFGYYRFIDDDDDGRMHGLDNQAISAGTSRLEKDQNNIMLDDHDMSCPHSRTTRFRRIMEEAVINDQQKSVHQEEEESDTTRTTQSDQIPFIDFLGVGISTSMTER